MTYIFTVSQIEPKTFHIFKTSKPVTIGDKVIFQTAIAESEHVVAEVFADRGLMKGYTAVGFEKIKEV